MDNSIISEHTCSQSSPINSCMSSRFSFLFHIYFFLNRIKLINHRGRIFSFNSRKENKARKYSRLFNKFGLGELVMKIFIFSFFTYYYWKANTPWSPDYAFYWSERIFNDLHIACWHFAFTSKPSHCVSFRWMSGETILMSQWHLNWIDSYKRNSNYPSSFFILISRSDEFVGMFVHLIQ